MDYKQCTHYVEILQILSENGNLDDVGFEIDDIQNCIDCSKNGGVCSLWVNLCFVIDMKQQMNIEMAKVTIDTLDEQLGKVVRELVTISPKPMA